VNGQKTETETERIIKKKLKTLTPGQQRAFRKCVVDTQKGMGLLSGPPDDMRLAKMALENITAMLTDADWQAIRRERPGYFTGDKLVFVDLGKLEPAQC